MQLLRVTAPCPARRRACRARAKSASAAPAERADPEAPVLRSPFQRIGFAGGIPAFQLSGRERQARLLGELAIVNSRLAHSATPPHEVRKKVEWVQRRRRNWGLIYDYITRNDVDVTLEEIEAASTKASARAAGRLRPSSRRRDPEREVGSAPRSAGERVAPRGVD